MDEQPELPAEHTKERQLPATNGDVSGLMELAINKEVPVEVLERLMDLHERVDQRNARAAFFDALANVQEEMPEVKKTKEAKIKTRGGGQYSYTYAPLESITRTVRPILRQHGLSYSWDTRMERDGVLEVVCVLRHVDGHEERSTFPVPVDTEAAMSDAQKNGAALTYGRRQSLLAVLGLTTADEDTDGADPKRHATITEDQVAELNGLLGETGSDVKRFCEWLGVDHIGAITQDAFPRAKAALEKKKGAAT